MTLPGISGVWTGVRLGLRAIKLSGGANVLLAKSEKNKNKLNHEGGALSSPLT